MKKVGHDLFSTKENIGQGLLDLNLIFTNRSFCHSQRLTRELRPSAKRSEGEARAQFLYAGRSSFGVAHEVENDQL